MGLYNISIALFFYLEIFLSIVLIRIKNKKALIFILILLFSFLYSKTVKEKYDNSFIIQEDYYIAKVVSFKEGTDKYVLKIKSGKYRNYQVLSYIKENLQYGDIIRFEDVIEKPDKARNDKRF